MSRDAIDDIFYLLERSRKDARFRFRQEFNVDPSDPSLDAALDEILRAHWRADEETEFLVPAHIVLGLALRPRGKGRGRQRPEKERWAARQSALAVRIASRLWLEYVRAGVPSKQAKDMAVDAVVPRLSSDFRYAAISESTLRSRMKLSASPTRRRNR